MKVNRKYLQKICRPQEYINFSKTLFDLARKQNEIIPRGVEFEVVIADKIIELNGNGKPPFFVGASCGEDQSMDQVFAESLGLDLYNYLKSR